MCTFQPGNFTGSGSEVANCCLSVVIEEIARALNMYPFVLSPDESMF